MTIGISNKWPEPRQGYLTTKGVIELGRELKQNGIIQHHIPQPQVLLNWLSASASEKRRAGFPVVNGTPLGKRHLHRGPGPRGGRFEWPESVARDVLAWYSNRLAAGQVKEKP
jgi:hypothetical protein